jgi:hypothetical protein
LRRGDERQPVDAVCEPVDLQPGALLKDGQRPEPRLDPFELDVRHSPQSDRNANATPDCSKTLLMGRRNDRFLH